MKKEKKTGFSFEEFEIDINRRLLLKEGEAVNLNPKAFDLLLTLVKNHGKLLSKDELLNTVWENQFVEENNLTVHITALNSLKLLTHSSGAKNLPSRQRTMRETIQWSYDLLDANEKVLLRRLAIFVGGFSIEAAEAVVSGQWSVVSGQ
jgi:DNA-binding response OmpR family regulator